jgi:predicted RNA binding protein YcfA (HicA-like mRNA interferase family)
MSPKLLTITPKKLIRILKNKGFIIDHQTGSHISMSHPDYSNRFAVIPFHRGNIRKGTLMST